MANESKGNRAPRSYPPKPQKEELKVDVPAAPRHFGALGEIPQEVQDAWKAKYVEIYRRSVEEDLPHNPPVRTALREANYLLKVRAPKDHVEARDLPDWQLMLRQELEVASLPSHARRDLADAEAMSSRYLRVVTTDGDEFFFPITEQPEPGDVKKEENNGKSN